MASVTRRLKRWLSWRAAGSDPAKALPMTEGFVLCQRLERAARNAGATDPLHFLEYLKRMRRGYSPAVDGDSYLMKLVDDILEFEKREGGRVAELAKQKGN